MKNLLKKIYWLLFVVSIVGSTSLYLIYQHDFNVIDNNEMTLKQKYEKVIIKSNFQNYFILAL